MTVDEARVLKGQHHLRRVKSKVKRRRKPRPAHLVPVPDLGLGTLGVETTAIAPPRPSAPPEADGESYAKTLVIPGVRDVVKGAARGAIYGALFGDPKAGYERRIAGGAAGGAISFPALRMLGDMIKAHLANTHGVTHPAVHAVVDGAAHVGGAAASVAAAGGEATDGAVAGAVVVVGKHVIDWLVER
jgi:hypothetical protein